jgi:CRP-like cAMP-binding protein
MPDFKVTLPKTSNRILSELPTEEYERLSPHFELLALSLGDILYYPHDPVTHVYFPNRGSLSIISTFADGNGVEVGVVGNEGVFGTNVVLGSVTTPLEALVQVPGDGLRISAEVIKKEFKAGGLLQDLLLRYTQAFIIQIAQAAACNRAHPVDGRLARWLLMTHDRAMSDELYMTQELIAVMLGTRRAGITEAAGKLQNEGVIRYNRGRIRIIDRARLEAYSCACYAIVKKEFDRLLG